MTLISGLLTMAALLGVLLMVAQRSVDPGDLAPVESYVCLRAEANPTTHPGCRYNKIVKGAP